MFTFSSLVVADYSRRPQYIIIGFRGLAIWKYLRTTVIRYDTITSFQEYTQSFYKMFGNIK